MELKDILQVVSTTTNIRKELILGNSRKDEVVTARFLYFYLARKHTLAKAKDISRSANRGCADYFYGLNKVDEWRKHNIHFRALYETVNNQIILQKQ